MATNNELQAELAQLRKLLAEYGIEGQPGVAVEPNERADFIGHGTEEHATFLGLTVVTGEDDPKANGRLTHTSIKTEVTYVLEDEVTPFMTFPDPRQVAELVLRQKVSEFESGAPPIFDGAPMLKIMRDQVPTR